MMNKKSYIVYKNNNKYGVITSTTDTIKEIMYKIMSTTNNNNSITIRSE